ncbi:hypothetical protein L228DRAFT_262024 [Xylona heveae TC161]|uniref:Kinetochore protein mis14 n=1 Tax=Xylona heveae (strain CBS 132557 / TC161) TaxID=1328760 RepID=A0A165G9P4_XYLHT|nr:hypothetical protein L228DRAFT_262024 [Xylona heveae TC161]KZF21913.1 hypothetical protein L228DRAFT_262024 [Xylona heveae TC161]
MDAPPAHRKIELQSPADMLYLVANARTAAREKLDLHFPPAAAPPTGEPDALRSRVEELVDGYILQTFGLAKSNISINGMDVDSSPELAGLWTGNGTGNGPEGREIEDEKKSEYEPFDTRLSSRLQSLSAALERETLALAALRREAPARAAAAYLDAERKAQEEDDLYEACLNDATSGSRQLNKSNGTKTNARNGRSNTAAGDGDGNGDVEMTGTGTGLSTDENEHTPSSNGTTISDIKRALNINSRKRPIDLFDMYLDNENNNNGESRARRRHVREGAEAEEHDPERIAAQKQAWDRESNLRIQEMARMYERALGTLVAEKGKVTGTVARCERARRAGEYVDGMK